MEFQAPLGRRKGSVHVATRSAHTAFAKAAAQPTPAVAVVDAHTVTRTAWPLVLPELAWAGAYATVAGLLAARPAADVVLLALHRTGVDDAPFPAWTGAIRSLAGAGYRVCLHTSERGSVLLTGCLAAGATAVGHTTDTLDELRAAVRGAAGGRRVVTPALIGLADADRSAVPSLTERQREILSARARGEKFESIARRLFISRKVAEEHWAAVARKYVTFLRDHSPADLERLLGLEPVHLADDPADRLAG